MRCVVTVRLACPAADAWRYLANFANDTEWRAGVLEMRQSHGGTAREGASLRETLRLAGLTTVTTCIVSRVDEGRQVTFRSITSRLPLRGWRSIEPSPGGCLVTLGFEARLPWPLAPADAVVGWLYRRRVANDAAHLAALFAESAAPAPLVVGG